MTNNKMLQSFYLVELEGNLIDSIFKNHSISKVTFISEEFNTDLEAIAILDRVVSSLTKNSEYTSIDEFNPEFFPSLPKIKVSEEQQNKQDALQEIIDVLDEQEDSDELPTRILVTRNFDEFGDNVQYKKNIANNTSKLTARVIMNKKDYMFEKIKQKHSHNQMELQAAVYFH